jgi:hypothetical protein
MNKVSLLSSCLCLILFSSVFAAAQIVVPERLKDVRTFYVDENSFRSAPASCYTQAGKITAIPCPEHVSERIKFLAALKRWLIKSGFTLVDDRAAAEGIVQGTLSIDDLGRSKEQLERDDLWRHKGPQIHDQDLPRWTVEGWIVNQKSRRIWRLTTYPVIGFAGGRAKIEGKLLAKAIEYDFKHH